MPSSQEEETGPAAEPMDWEEGDYYDAQEPELPMTEVDSDVVDSGSDDDW
jgi:hypothetical protein